MQTEQKKKERREKLFLTIRNIAAAAAVVLFVLSLLADPGTSWRAAGYFCGAAAYFAELLMLTDGFTRRISKGELFMAACFFPLYILLGISYLME